MRIALGIAAGVLIAFLTVAVVEWIGSLAFPVAPEPLHRSEAAVPLAGVSFPAMLVVVLAWFLGAFVGGWFAFRIGRRVWAIWAVAAAVVAAGILAIMMILHPMWMQVAAVIAPLLGALAAARLPRPAALDRAHGG